jgi:hypothetical protein
MMTVSDVALPKPSAMTQCEDDIPAMIGILAALAQATDPASRGITHAVMSPKTLSSQ